ncbi:spore germination protein GerPC [Anaerobacillus isosaccharinicus]|uniref:Spore gernimation protein n=1 Tax=Anaerobacillus isosaccharinicus TaxID=1532552 RepID=A0A1S2L7S0_9BACI|nr:spore germination protein GerPC [Anaerobacillus isosaccharinicus]MBA5587570.1 spore gernimation protein [Anaerobacillus isosaccharinicus]QOY34253.1 spore gernimation protein [Anaerobacillus isosaccharinicus]
MYYNYDINTTLQHLYQCLEAQQKKIDYLEMKIVDLQSGLEMMRQENAGKVERIEYKFDQLKVERLEGTLNIGITPTGGIEPTSIEDFSVNRNSIDVPPNSSQQNQFLFENIKKSVYGYLNRECYDVMASLERQYNYQLDGPYRDFIIDDVRKQIDPRIKHYLRGLNIVENDENKLKEFEEATINNVITDINQTIEQFIKHLPNKGE